MQFFLCICILMCFSACQQAEQKLESKKGQNETDSIIIDSNYTFDEAIEGSNAPKHIIDQLQLITVHYYSFDGKIHRGQLLVNRVIAADLVCIFRDLLQHKFPIDKVIPIVKYGWDDEKSMNDNNTSSFCYRNIAYSKHALGLAIDMNPMQNPIRWRDGYTCFRKNKPEAAVYNPTAPGTIVENGIVVELFKAKNFLWGRYFKRNNDDHHFEKKAPQSYFSAEADSF